MVGNSPDAGNRPESERPTRGWYLVWVFWSFNITMTDHPKPTKQVCLRQTQQDPDLG